MANPQKEDGYTAIANEIMDALIRYRIPGEQRQCLDFIIRKTYGYNKKEDMISNSQFVHATGLKKSAVCRANNELVKKNIVIKKDNTSIPIYRFNKNYNTWKVLTKKITVNKNDNGVNKKDNNRLQKRDPQKTKDNITKDNIGECFKFKKAVPIPSTIYLTDRMKNYAKKQGCEDEAHIHELFEDFTNHHAKKGDKLVNWTRAFYTWVRNDKKHYNPDKYTIFVEI